MTNGYLPCRMISTFRSAGELLDRAVGLDRVGLLLHPVDELVRRAASVEQLVGGRPQFLVQILVPPIEQVEEGVLAGRGERLGGALLTRGQAQALCGTLKDGQG